MMRVLPRGAAARVARCIAYLLILALGASACSPPPGRRAFDRTSLSPEEVSAARAALEELRGLSAQDDASKTLDAGLDLLRRYPGFEAEAEVMHLTAAAAQRSGRGSVAERLWESLVVEHDESPYALDARWNLAALMRSRGERLGEARQLIRLHDRLASDSPRRAALRQRLRTLLDREMPLEELDELNSQFGQSFVGSSVAWAAIARAEAEQREPVEIGQRLERFLIDYPESRHRDEANAWLARLVRSEGYESSADLSVVRVDRIGVLCPLSGEYSALGQAMYDGALLALEEHNRASEDSLSMVGLDTRGDEVVAVLAARELIEADQAIAIVGGLTSSTTTAIAVLCQERGVPLVSPTATNENISQLGNYIFQTNLTKDFETQLVARVAVEGLMRRRLAILYPDDEDGRSKANLFAAEVERLGARVVASEALQRGQTDFGAAIRRIRQSGPEALFVPVAPSEMRLLGPQLVFNDLRVQLLGPSTWNNSSLLRQAQDSLDRAIVPSDQALVSQSEAEHFTLQWRRRFPEQAVSPFAQKSYFAMRRIIEALDPEGEDTRERLRTKIEMAMLSPGQTGESPFEKLRVLSEEGVSKFPASEFPGLFAMPGTVEPDSLDLLDDSADALGPR